MRKLILPVLMTLIPATLSAFDVYFYKNTVDKPIAQVTDVQKMVFSTDGTTVTDGQGVSTTIALEDADYFTMTNTTGVGNIAAGKGIKVAMSGTTLTVNSADALRSVELIGTNGATVAMFAVSGTQADVDLSAVKSGVYLVRINTETSVSVKKILIAD